MPAKSKRVPVSGSERNLVPGARAVGAVPADERVEVTVRLRPRSALNQMTENKVDQDVLPKDRKYMSREDFAQQYGADPADIEKVIAFARNHNLVVEDTNLEGRTIHLSGTAADMSAAFGTELQQYESPKGTFRGRVGSLTMPEDLHGIVEGVFGLDNRPQARPHFVYVPTGIANPHGGGTPTSYTPPQLASLYDFPSDLDGLGQTIGIIELSGGYRTADIKAYFKSLGLPAPKVKTVRVDGARNRPSTDPNSADGEVMLDIEVAAAIAPKAKIVVYFAPNTDQGFLDAIIKALHDTKNKPSVISISWGSAEINWTEQSLNQYNQAFQSAAALGVTICAASGDNGSSDGVSDGQNHVDFPASSPFVLGCGGTHIAAANTTITDETVWNNLPNGATGGGVSNVFAKPTYQQNAPVPGGNRGVPDVAGDADPDSGYVIRVDGQEAVFGGTSAVAPLWAGLIAQINQKLGTPVGFLNPLLYGSLLNQGVTRDIVLGNNGNFSANPGWDACTGWGSPLGSALLACLQG